MSNNMSIQGFSFLINVPSQVTATPTSQNIINTFDLIGDFLSLKRLSGETNVEYKQRLLDVSVHPGSPVYEGMMNNLCRDLGLPREKAIQITLNLTSGGDTVARNPRADILANKVVLYSDWRPGGEIEVIDKEIRTYQTDDDGYFLEDLVAEINTSDCFSATIYSGVRPNLHSTNLFQVTSDYIVQNDPIISDSRTKLSAQYIIEDSWVFTERDIFFTEVTGTPATDGEYLIDRTEGVIYAYSLPSGEGGISYHAALFPLDIDFSLIKAYTLQDDNFTTELFNKKTLPSGEETNALPNTEGSELYHQLYKEVKVLWGN